MKHRHLDPQTNPAGGNGTNIIDPPPAIDFNALARPEGAPDLGENFSTDSLPNLDPPNTQNNGANNNQPPSPDPKQPPPPKPDPAADPNDPFPFKGIKSEHNRVLIEKLADKYGENFQLPEDVNDENVFEHIENVMRPRIDFHPEVLKMNEAVKSGIPMEQVIKGYNQLTDLKSLPAKDLVITHLKGTFGKTEKNPTGWEDAKINDIVTKMESNGMLDIEAEKIRYGINQQQANYLDNLKKQQESVHEKSMEDMNKSRETEIKATLTQFSQLNDVFGIPLSQSEKADFSEDLRYLVTPKENGVAPVLEWLQSNDNLAKVAYLMQKGDAKVKEALTLAKSKAKTDFMNKLDTEPKLTPKANPLMTQAIDFDALARPANN